MLFTAMMPSSESLSGPRALHSRSTIKVDAGAVAIDTEASSRATCHGWPKSSIVVSTMVAASIDSISVRRTILPPMRRTRLNSKTPPMEKRIKPSATSLSASSACMFSWLTQPSTDGPSTIPATM